MLSPIETILRKSTRKDNEPLNIISFPTHEPYQTALDKTGHKFYLWQSDATKSWNNECGILPPNHILLNKDHGEQQLPLWIEPDLVLSQNKFGQFAIAKKLADTLKIPLISLEHTLPVPEWPKSKLKILKMMRGDINLFISNYSRSKWGWSEDEADIIHHGIDTNFFIPIPDKTRENHLLVVCNDYINRSWCVGFDVFQRITGYPNQKLIPFKAFGKTPGFSEYAPTRESLNVAYNECGCFLNTATQSPIPTVVLEAMSAGTPVVSTKNPMLCEIIQHGKNGFLSDNPDEMRNICQELIKNKDLAQQVGYNSRQTILERFPLNKFIENWNSIFKTAIEIK